ncbi:regulatory protein RecX [Sphingomonas sp. HHU CXW]|uniref:Regulatory protein RecX n=1 Tax=Sphingomonas hominis TaxID=2741495 RepID=A0ABX2JFN0_9SPHN|nr:regulatory protein RecX [Sphingomonas hominis]
MSGRLNPNVQNPSLLWHNQGVDGSSNNRRSSRARTGDDDTRDDRSRRAGGARERRTVPPLTAVSLEGLALRYVERFATTRGKLSDYLRRKIRERGWEGEAADVTALAERFAERGYVDDRAYAEMKTASLARRGFGERRISAALHAARVEANDAAEAVEQVRDGAFEQAMAFARRKRIGPFARHPVDDDQRRKQLAAMLRAGHSFTLANKIVRSCADPDGNDD